jgi:stage V sporulation protein K
VTAPTSSAPESPRQLIRWLEAGKVSTTEALSELRRLESGRLADHLVVADDRRPVVERVLRELDALVGLAGVKQQVREIWALVEIQQRRRALQLNTDAHTLHMVFRGAPGTGKTTVARVLGRLFHALNVLPKGHLVEVERADLVGEYIGHTAQKTREAVRRALGGILFVDEAYALARGGEKDFGKEAIDTLVKSMEDHKEDFLLVLAGYPQEMTAFLQANPGLLSRLPIHLTFPNYDAAEMLEIAERMLEERQYRASDEAREYLRRFFGAHTGLWHANAGNGRLVRNMVERAIRRQAVRMMSQTDNPTRDQLMLLERQDWEQNP